jgi:hypothetical protein
MMISPRAALRAAVAIPVPAGGNFGFCENFDHRNWVRLGLICVRLAILLLLSHPNLRNLEVRCSSAEQNMRGRIYAMGELQMDGM